MNFAARKVLLAKMKLPDHAQLLVKFLSKKIFKNFEKFRKYFYFFGWKIFGIFEILIFDFQYDFQWKNIFFEISEIFENFENFQDFRNFRFQKISEIFGNVSDFFIFWDDFFMDFKIFWCSAKLRFCSLQKVVCLFMKYASLGLCTAFFENLD